MRNPFLFLITFAFGQEGKELKMLDTLGELRTSERWNAFQFVSFF